MGRRPRKKRPPTPSESDDELVSMFPVGAEVEVRSDDPGFAGSFYEATVAGHLVSRSGGRRYTLAYSTLLAEEGGRPLKETAAVADVRPRPPPPPQGNDAPREFAVCDMVEAFHNDGWWAGVVSAVPPPPLATGDRRPLGLYEVTFPASRETMEFEGTALRPHRVFQDGRWVPAAEVDNGSPLFSEGIRVEVSQSADNFGGSWSPATVSKVIGAEHFLVQYIHIEKNGKLATEIVDSRYIRPACVVARMDSRNRFSTSSHIEVFHQGGWWPGVIVEILGSGINKKYVVRFKNHETVREDVEHVSVLTVENTQLRLRYNWVGKKWVRFVKEKSAKRPRLTAQKRPISSAPALYDEGDGSSRDKKLRKADIVSESVSPLLSVRNEKYEKNHVSCSHLEETMEQGTAVLALGSQSSLPSLQPMAALGLLSSSSYAPSCPLDQSSQMMIVPYTPQGPYLGTSCHLDQSSQMMIVPYTPQGPYLGTWPSNSDWSEIALNDQEKQSDVLSRTDLSKQKEEYACFQTPDALGERTETTEEVIDAKPIEEDDDIMAIFEGLDQLPNEMIAGCEILPEINTESCVDLTPRKDIRGSQGISGVHDLQKVVYAGETSIEQDSGEDLRQRSLAIADDANVRPSTSAKGCEAPVHDDQLCMDYTTAIVQCMTGDEAPSEDLYMVSPANLDVVSNPFQSDVNFDGITENPAEQFSDGSQSIEKSEITPLPSVGMGDSAATEPTNSLAIIKYKEATPISKYVASRTYDSSCPLLPKSAGVQGSVIDTNRSHLPFVKTSPMWAELESLEIFSKVPQRPHFQLLQHLCPELCEGMAFGLMFSFAQLAESINRLDVHDENGLLEEKMVVLCLLEANGFDVSDLNSRLEALIDTKISRVGLQNAMNKLEEKIAKKETEDRELSTRIRTLAKALHCLDVHAYLMRDMMMSAISQKMNQAMEIQKLKTEANKLE